jgi:hypothetical protein
MPQEKPVMALQCEVTNGELTIRSETGTLLWRGRLDDHRVWSAASVAPDDGCLVLLVFEEGPKNFRNLLRCRSDGTVVWHAELPDQTGPDAYVSFRIANHEIIANSWSGFQMVIDRDTGWITRKSFTK